MRLRKKNRCIYLINFPQELTCRKNMNLSMRCRNCNTNLKYGYLNCTAHVTNDALMQSDDPAAGEPEPNR